MLEQKGLPDDYIKGSSTTSISDSDSEDEGGIEAGPELMTEESLSKYISGKPRRIEIKAKIIDNKN